MRSAANVRTEYQEWLAGAGQYDVFVTVTFKQALRNDQCGFTRLTDEQCHRTLRLVRDRVANAVLGKKRVRSGERLTFIPFHEGGDEAVRHHAHICTRVPDGITFEEFRHRFAAAASNLDWVHRELHFAEVTDDSIATRLRIVGYSLKEGSDAFVPEAASI